MLRYAGAPRCLCKLSGAAYHFRSVSVGPTAVWRAPARRPGGLERGDPRTRRWPSTNPIAPTKQRLTKSSGVPRAAARISFAGPSRTKSQSRNARSTGQAANWTCPIPPSNSRPGWNLAWGLETAGNVDGKFGAENLPLRGPSRSARPARRWFSCNFFHAPDIIVRWCGWIDLVAPSPAAKMMTNRFGDRQPKRTR